MRIEGLKSLYIVWRFFGMCLSAVVKMSLWRRSMAVSMSVWCWPSSCEGWCMLASVVLKSSQLVDL